MEIRQMLTWIAVGVGGALGSMARHGVNRLVNQQWPGIAFPLATTIINVLGCCLIGILAGLLASGRLPMRLVWREFVFVGVIGSFTTFSTFGLETIALVRTGNATQAVSSAAVQLLCGLGGLHVALVLCERVATAGR